MMRKILREIVVGDGQVRVGGDRRLPHLPRWLPSTMVVEKTSIGQLGPGMGRVIFDEGPVSAVEPLEPPGNRQPIQPGRIVRRDQQPSVPLEQPVKGCLAVAPAGFAATTDHPGPRHETNRNRGRADDTQSQTSGHATPRPGYRLPHVCRAGQISRPTPAQTEDFPVAG